MGTPPHGIQVRFIVPCVAVFLTCELRVVFFFACEFPLRHTSPILPSVGPGVRDPAWGLESLFFHCLRWELLKSVVAAEFLFAAIDLPNAVHLSQVYPFPG